MHLTLSGLYIVIVCIRTILKIFQLFKVDRRIQHVLLGHFILVEEAGFGIGAVDVSEGPTPFCLFQDLVQFPPL